ncbi:hypothetical protein SAMN04488128_103207 [Chitinophaga eiseniae]|uniref:Uncharacterized protein n=1 Tax=Chitinophaga eiseniae TaxID=634771 RepID=A0A1T4SPD6_9BACT|nr:hypothetical protein [Chitinophaga eiseniae]SKA30033.1 hypothetical protein SAMN04488128_103207 [Chitinophaga eiseniae]
MSTVTIIAGIPCKPFDRQKAESGAPVISRNALRLVDFYFFNTHDDQPLYGQLQGDYCPRRYTETGKYFTDGSDSEYDLFIMPTTTTMYCSVYLEDGRFITGNTLYETREQAESDLVDGSWVGEVKFNI